MKHVYTIEDVKQCFEKENFILISPYVYKSTRQKFEYICPHGHQHSISFGKWLEGRRCPYCDGQGKPSVGFIKFEFLKEGYILLSSEYVNSKHALEYICPKGHNHKISWHNWKSGQRCPYCSGGYVSRESIVDYFSSRGYKVINITDLGWRAVIMYECGFGHRHVTRNNSKCNLGCPTCAYIKKSGLGHPGWKGGISCEPYCDIWVDKEYKISILERDNYKCQNPYCSGRFVHKLVLHHIDYNKKNCHPSNLITLCNSCNSRANFNREYWQNLYTNGKVWWGKEA